MSDGRSGGVAAKRDRAMARLAYQQRQRGDYDEPALTDSVSAKLAAPAPKSRKHKAIPKGFATSDVSRWVPIGPSVVRQGQGTGRPRVTGRIRDLAVSPDGSRVYAASARGGVWFSGDSGSTWAPIGGWAERPVGTGGANNAQSCGALLVSFGATPADDFVLVGTGEGVPFISAVAGQYGGIGVLAARGPAVRPVSDNPWEAESGLGLLRGLGVLKLARDPASTAESTAGPTTDRVLAATSDGLFLGTRQAAPLQFTWARLPGPDALMGVAPAFTTPAPPAWAPGDPVAISDVAWLGTRIVIAVNQRGLAFSDDGGATFSWLGGCNWPVSGRTVQGLSTFALAPGTTTLYTLTGLRRTAGLPAAVDDDTALFVVPDIAAAAPAATRVTGVPTRLWPGQRDYDQAIAVDAFTDGTGTHHNVYLGGSFTTVGPTFDASLWCFQVGVGSKLVAAPGVSRTGNANEGAVAAGHIGVGVHADVHAIKVNVLADGRRQVWVGCDGGVYASGQAGRAYTFLPRNTGLAVLEAGFSATHPRLSHLSVAGLQDNGTQLRNGDTVWEEIFEGDGGGVAFDPVQPHRVVGQYIRASWAASPGAGFQSPTSRIAGGGTFVGDRENTRPVSEFYSGAATTVAGGGTTRLAVGTNRIWLCDDLGTAAMGAWRALPFPGPRPARDVRPHGNDPLPRFGVPAGALTIPAMAAGAATGPLGNVVALKWAAPTVLVVLFRFGVVVWTEAPPGTWTAAFTADWMTFAGAPTFTDIAPVPGTGDFYLTTTGDPNAPAEDTCFLWDGATSALVPTRLRNVLDSPPPVVPGPIDPAYAAVVDPAKPLEVYVGTVTGVWHGVRAAGTTNIAWGPTPFVNGLPQAAVQDLTIHFDPANPTPRLLRAAVQSRGVWEVDLAANEPVRTYLRTHQYDDRRRLPTPLADPRAAVPPAPAPAPVLRADSSPDITVRPRSGAGIAPTWQLGAAKMTAANAPTYQLWTFQTAFRWRYPSVLATGSWSRSFEQLVRLQRTISTPGSPGAFIDKALWDAVVATRIDPVTGLVSANAGDPLAVYQPPWRTPTAMAAGATEIDLVECVVPPGAPAGVWTVHREPSTVEVLLHHRDTRPMLGGESHAVLLWRSDPAAAVLLGLGAADIVTFLGQSALTGNVAAAPGGWNLAGPASGAAALSLGTGLDARIPRALPFDVDLSGINAGDFVLFAAVAWSDKDKAVLVPSLPGPPAVPTIVDLARGWPYLALRLVQVTPRPA
jgi:hypothetical protein